MKRVGSSLEVNPVSNFCFNIFTKKFIPTPTSIIQCDHRNFFSFPFYNVVVLTFFVKASPSSCTSTSFKPIHHFVGMGFSREMVIKAIDKHGCLSFSSNMVRTKIHLERELIIFV